MSEKELRDEVEQQQRKKFVEAINEVEKAHGYKIIAMMNYTQSGVFPTLGLTKHETQDNTDKGE